ncbi:hypothetical protein N8596_00390, partial [bacterium]|nr:hypothetical protein [bacterium]
EACDDELETMHITRGLLVRRVSPPGSRLEFRWIKERGVLLTALQDYAPSLPWPIYMCSQAWLHLMVMAGFRRWLRRRSRD